MFSINSEDFLNDPLSFGFNIAKQICIFLTFKDLSDVKRTQFFGHIIFSRSRRTREEKVNRECDKVQ
jgi:hypothetical protein